MELPFVLGGQHDWQMRSYPHLNMPALDVLAGDLHFSFLSKSPTVFGIDLLPKYRILQESFRRRLLQGEDVVPILPIFLDPRHVLRLKDDSLFYVYLDQQWQEAVLWGLQSLPSIPIKDYDTSDMPQTWESRRTYLEEASRTAFFSVIKK